MVVLFYLSLSRDTLFKNWSNMVKVFKGFLSYILLGIEFFGLNAIRVLFVLFKINISFLTLSLNHFLKYQFQVSVFWVLVFFLNFKHFLTTWLILCKYYPRRNLLAQSEQWKHQSNVWNLFKINNKEARATSLTSFWCLHR